MINNVLVLLLDSYFDAIYKILKRLKIVVGTSGISVELQKTPGIEERIAKIDEAKANLMEGLRVIDELRNAAESNKREVEVALAQIAKLHNDRESLQQELQSLKTVAQSDITAFRKMAGVPSSADIRKERLIGFISGVLSSLVASGFIWLIVGIINYFVKRSG